MEKSVCLTCHNPKAVYHCGICQNSLCKSCVQFLDEDSFSFLPKVPAELQHTTYCAPCFDQNVVPAREAYEQTMAQAKEISVYMKNQGKETRLIKRLEDPVFVTECADREETVLRLAFFAAQMQYNALVDVDLQSEKVKIGTYQTTKWKGSAVPAQVNADKLVKDRSIWQNPN